MLVTELGRVMEVREVQPLNAEPPMLVTELGMVMEVREEQSSNAQPPMLVTELGMVTEVREEQPLNAWSPMLVTELGMVVDWHPAIRVLEAVSIMALQFSRESYIVLPLSTTMEVREVQLSNTSLVISFTEAGMMIEVREVQLLNV